MTDVQRELIKSKKSFMNFFYGLMLELNTTGEINLDTIAKCLKGLKEITFAQRKNFKKKQLQTILIKELELIKKIALLIKDYKKNKKNIINFANSLSELYEKEKKILYA